MQSVFVHATLWMFAGLQTCMNREFSLAGVGASQVLRSACVHAGVLGEGVQDNQGIFRVIVHKRVVAALREKNVVLQQIRQILICFRFH